MGYLILADFIVILHGLFILFAAGGGFLLLSRRWWAWLHAPAFLWAGYIELTGGICPLTPLENRLRYLGGSNTYQSDFIGRYLLPVIYPESITRNIQIVIATLVLSFNVILYIWIWRRKQKKSCVL